MVSSVSPLPVPFEKTGDGRPGPAKNNTCVIMSRLEQLRVSGQMIFLAVAGAAVVAPCADVFRAGYLSGVGPLNLRFASASSHEKLTPTQFSLANTNLAKIEIPPAGNAAGPVKTFPAPTNAAPAASVVMKADSTPSPFSLSALNLAPGRTDPSIVTPEMLADYLKPSPAGNHVNSDNNPANAVPVNPGFTPPSPVPGNTSRAVYKNE